MVDYQSNDLREDYPPPVPRPSRHPPLECQGRQWHPACGARVTTAIDAARAELSSRCDSIEECYEFMLAYAAQGLPSDQGSNTGTQVRDYLRKCDGALSDLASFLMRFVEQLNLESTESYGGF